MFSAKISNDRLTKHSLESKVHCLVTALGIPFDYAGSILNHLAELIAAL